MLDNLFSPTHLIIISFFLGFFVVIPYWMIWKKAGFSPWLSLLMIFPPLGFLMLWILALVPWKVVPVVADGHSGLPLPARFER
jgi:hypothetical protein